MPWFRSIFLIKIVLAVFEIFRKKVAKKKTLFSCTMYGQVKKGEIYYATAQEKFSSINLMMDPSRVQYANSHAVVRFFTTGLGFEMFLI